MPPLIINLNFCRSRNICVKHNIQFIVLPLLLPFTFLLNMMRWQQQTTKKNREHEIEREKQEKLLQYTFSLSIFSLSHLTSIFISSDGIRGIIKVSALFICVYVRNFAAESSHGSNLFHSEKFIEPPYKLSYQFRHISSGAPLSLLWY